MRNYGRVAEIRIRGWNQRLELDIHVIGCCEVLLLYLHCYIKKGLPLSTSTRLPSGWYQLLYPASVFRTCAVYAKKKSPFPLAAPFLADRQAPHYDRDRTERFAGNEYVSGRSFVRLETEEGPAHMIISSYESSDRTDVAPSVYD